MKVFTIALSPRIVKEPLGAMLRVPNSRAPLNVNTFFVKEPSKDDIEGHIEEQFMIVI